MTEYSLGLVLARLAIVAPLFAPLLLPLLVAVYRAHARSSALRAETDVALRRLADIVDERDPSTFDHSHRVGELVRDLTRALKLSERDVETLSRAGRLHDLGKVMVDRSVLQKPGALDDDEFAQVRLHPAVSARLLGTFGFAREEARAVEMHHERFDGRGYYGVPVDDIPLSAHCLILADSWDAMTSDRPYRPGMSPEVAATRIEEALGTQFHPILGRVFLAVQAGRRPEDVADAVQLMGLRRRPRDRSPAEHRRHASHGLVGDGAACRPASWRRSPSLSPEWRRSFRASGRRCSGQPCYWASASGVIFLRRRRHPQRAPDRDRRAGPSGDAVGGRLGPRSARRRRRGPATWSPTAPPR